MDNTNEYEHKPKIINLVYSITPYWASDYMPSSLEREEERIYNFLNLIYSDDYQIVRDEYVVNETVVYHHIIAKRIDHMDDKPTEIKGNLAHYTVTVHLKD